MLLGGNTRDFRGHFLFLLPRPFSFQVVAFFINVTRRGRDLRGSGDNSIAIDMTNMSLIIRNK